MGKVPVDLRKNIAANIRGCRNERYPMRGGSKQCAQAFGVSPRQWSQWECGAHMPDEFRMLEIARFFGVSTEYLRSDNARDLPPNRPQTRFGAACADDGGEAPLRVEVERMVSESNYVVEMERIV